MNEELNFDNLRKFHKYLYNKIGSKEFAEAMKKAIGANDEYVDERWQQFKKSPIQFVASYDRQLFNVLYKDMIECDYQG